MVPTVSADAPLPRGCEVTGRRLEGEGGKQPTRQVKVLLGLEGPNQRALEKSEREPSGRDEPQGRGYPGVERLTLRIILVFHLGTETRLAGRC